MCIEKNAFQKMKQIKLTTVLKLLAVTGFCKTVGNWGSLQNRWKYQEFAKPLTVVGVYKIAGSNRNFKNHW